MARTLITLVVGTGMLLGCGRMDEAVKRQDSGGLLPQMSGTSVLTLQTGTDPHREPTMVLIPVSSVPLIRPSVSAQAVPLGIPDMTDMRFYLYAGSHVALMMQDGQLWRGRVYRLGHDLAFTVELAGGARLQGLIHLMAGRSQATFLVTLEATDAMGNPFAGNGEFRAFTRATRRSHVPT
ncbi:MAG: hypothetical protein H7338_17940 [Candidatus Sericytochromatia bacterium]|nr:hypothetical protein [Candidatus Sericytochromatia bacterium]